MDLKKYTSLQPKISTSVSGELLTPAKDDGSTTPIYTRNNIFGASYSGTPVYETLINGIAVMRRRTDNFLNATQILKVAGLDKGKRTKILDQEFVHEEHEKIQGGYGKFQGTWVPYDRGVDLAKKYNVEHLIRHLLDFEPIPGERVPEKTPNKDFVGALRRHLSGNSNPAVTQTPGVKKRKDASASAQDDQSKRVKSAIFRSGGRPIAPAPPPGESPSQSANVEKSPHQTNSQPQNYVNNESDDIRSEVEEKHRSLLCSAFLGEEWDQLPSVLTQLPSNMNFDISLDMMGNSALHWAAVLGHVKVVEFLVKKGATQTLPNHHGVTPLARAVMERYNYDYKTFPKMITLLAPCLNHLDKYRRSVFHYVVFTAKDPERIAAAVYYLKCLMDFIHERKLDGAKALNLQDDDGNTALNIAVNLGIGQIISLLHEAGANPAIANKAGVAPEDYGPNWANPRASSSQDTATTHQSLNQPLNPPSGYVENFFPHSSRLGSTSLISKATQLSTMVTNFIQELEADFQHRLGVEASKCDRLQAELTEAKQTIQYLEEQLNMHRPASYYPYHMSSDHHPSASNSTIPTTHNSSNMNFYTTYKNKDKSIRAKTPQPRVTNGSKPPSSVTQSLAPIRPRPQGDDFSSPNINFERNNLITTPKLKKQLVRKPILKSNSESAIPTSPLEKYSSSKDSTLIPPQSTLEESDPSDDEIASYTPYSIQPQITPSNDRAKAKISPISRISASIEVTTPDHRRAEASSKLDDAPTKPDSSKEDYATFEDDLDGLEELGNSQDGLDTTQSPDYFPDHQNTP